MTHLKRDVIVLFGETLSSKPGKSTVRAQSSANSSSLISDETILLYQIQLFLIVHKLIISKSFTFNKNYLLNSF